MKKKAIDRARREKASHVLPGFGQDLLIKTLRSTCLLSKGTSASQVPQQHKNCSCFCWERGFAVTLCCV